MISDEAVEAAAAAIEARTRNWLHPLVGGNAYDIARAALESAARESALMAREQARRLEAVTSIAVRLGASTQGEDRDLSEELYAAMGLT